ncbi:DUF3006 domain-containing protein [Virgibacillus byunsanensis]|uniref:DUF3006 domain-containing protein n=1 Tax=Virgibacillus byunsanensis TaxID=570945 RepID=A0ABW3LHQ7_9BACI
MKGVLDRFEDNDKAVILIEEEMKALVIPAEELPKGSEINTYFNIKEKNGDYKILSIDQETTEKEAQKASNLMEKLRAKTSGSKFKKK